MTSLDKPLDVQASEHHWRERRRYLNDNRHRLSRLAEHLYEDTPSVRGLVTTKRWIPSAPVPLEHLKLLWSPDHPAPQIHGTEPASAPIRALTAPGKPFPSYADALGELARPALFEDRPCYRLVDVATDGDKPRLSFGRATFFDIVNVCEAVAHEFAQAAEAIPSEGPVLPDLPFRQLVGHPCDLTNRPVIPAISVLTIRRSRKDGPAVVLHQRDSAKVAHGGGLYQVMPVGIFQPSSPAPWNEGNDFDLWRSIAREYGEEFLGTPEIAGDDAPIDYDAWPFFQALEQARFSGHLNVYWLGLGMDPLSLVADLLVAAVFDDEVFDELFRDIVSTNAEGNVLTGANAGSGVAHIPFTHETVERYAKQRPMQAAGAALLELAWTHRDQLLVPRS